MKIKLIAGLSNPGPEYTFTRHNAGSWYVKLLAESYQERLKSESKFYGYTGQLTIGNYNIRLLIPNIFMNFNGTAVASMATFYQIEPEEILVAHDELDLLPGITRLKLGGGHGGHNGLKHIISCLKNNQQFYRLRIGIGHPGEKSKVSNFVLSKPTFIDYQLMTNAIKKAVDCTETLFFHGIIKTMNRLHTTIQSSNTKF
nr:aminoacyl-tRNA hydrolase [Sodalis sp. CWE]